LWPGWRLTTGWTVRRSNRFCVVKNSSEVYPHFSATDTGPFLGLKRPERFVDYLLPSSTRFRMGWRYAANFFPLPFVYSHVMGWHIPYCRQYMFDSVESEVRVLTYWMIKLPAHSAWNVIQENIDFASKVWVRSVKIALNRKRKKYFSLMFKIKY
jgi:hypothetical protein